MFSITYDARGGRGTSHLKELAETANKFSEVLIVLGNNNLGRLSDDEIIDNIRGFADSLDKKIKLRITAFLPRMDHDSVWSGEFGNWVNPVTRINKKLQREFGHKVASARNFERKDFGFSNNSGELDEPYHLNELVFKHMLRFIELECHKFVAHM